MSVQEVVISGMSGTFPECLNLKEMESAAFSYENLVNDNEGNWISALKYPTYVGKIRESLKFDQTFFGIHRRLCDVMDPHARLSIEKSFEAICDAGINPNDIVGSNIAVIMSSMTSESEYGSVLVSKTSGHAMLGHSRCMQSNRISYFFNFKGPSFALDSSWVGPMQGLEIAHNMVSKGLVKAAIVGGTNLFFYPEVCIHYDGLRKLNYDGKTKSYSKDADGYSRAEGVVTLFLQRKKDAMRSYGSLVKVRSGTEMNLKAVFSDHVGFSSFIREFYSTIPVPIPNSEIAYIEGDGSASLVNDAMELNALAEVLCEGRDKPLVVGSCKSRFGHAESASALMSVANALVALKTGYIPPCLNFSGNNPNVPGLEDGRLKIATEKTPIEGEYVGVTVFGLSSIYAHALIKRNPISRGELKEDYFPQDDIPRIFLLSGRSDEGMASVLKELAEGPVDEYYFNLNHNLFKTEFPKHLYRGFAIKGEKESRWDVIPYQSGSAKKPIWYIFSGMGSQWLGMGKGIMKIPVVRKAIEKCHEVLLPKGINLISLITEKKEGIFDNILHAFVGIAAIQIALVDLLEEIGITPDGIVGHSVGELGCSYADKCLTAEQVILAAYARGKASNDATLIRGMMAAVGKGYHDIKDSLPEGIEIACHNSVTSCTLSGPEDLMNVYVKELKDKGIFAKLVNVANIAYHSKNIAPAGPYLLKYLKEIIPDPKMRSSKWISSSVPEAEWNTELAKYCSAEYHTNNLLSYVLFEEATAHVPRNAICIEIAPHGLLQAVTKKSLDTCVHVPLTSRVKMDGCIFLIDAITKLYTNGVDVDLRPLYPPVDYPLPREIDYLGRVMTWDHSEDWMPISVHVDLQNYVLHPNLSYKDIELDTNELDSMFACSTHNVFGKTTFPKSHVLKCMIEFLDSKLKDNNAVKSSMKGYDFQNVDFIMDVPFDREGYKMQLLHQLGSGSFEALIREEVLIVGEINPLMVPLIETKIPSDFHSSKEPKMIINENQIYNFFQTNNCTFDGHFKSISSIIISEGGFTGKVKWTGDIVYFLDGVLKLIAFYSSIQNDTLMDVKFIKQFKFSPSLLPKTHEEIEIYYNKNCELVVGQGVQISYFKAMPKVDKSKDLMDVKDSSFMPYSYSIHSKIDFIDLCLQLIRENNEAEKLDLQSLTDEQSNICTYLINDIQEKKRLKSLQISIRVSNSKEVIFIPELLTGKGFDGCYLIIAENDLPQTTDSLIDSDIPLFVIHTGRTDSKSFKHLTPITDQYYRGHKVTIYKKVRESISDTNYSVLSFNYVEEVKLLEKKSSESINYLVYKFSLLIDTIDVLQSTHSCSISNLRYIFLDEHAPQFDPSNPFYKDQIKKDLKINISLNGIWGSIRDKRIPVQAVNYSNLKHTELPFNDIKCKNVKLKVVGLNLENIVKPSLNKKFGVLEFSGVMGRDEVFGIGKISEDNFLEIDSHLCWKKPADWTMEEAASVPLFYCLAYDIIYMKSKMTNRPSDSILIHGGHLPFCQALINVALSLDFVIHTTCFTQAEKQFISHKFPQINEKHIYVMDSGPCQFMDDLLRMTKGESVQIIVDGLEDPSITLNTVKYTGYTSTYFLVSNNSMDIAKKVGMSLFLRETCFTGVNSDMIFSRTPEEKLKLGGLLMNGIKDKIVKPFKNFTIKQPCTRKQATQIVVDESNKANSRRVLIDVMDVVPYQNAEMNTNAITAKKKYMIIGSYNNLWFDLTKWLVSRGAVSIHVVLCQNDIFEYVKKRFNNFISKHRYLDVTFSETDNLNTVQNCNEFIKKFQNGNTIDTVFYIKPGFEKQMINIDYALRTYSKTTNLISIGVHQCRITEKRLNDGFKGTCFVLMKSNLRNSMIVSVFDNWLMKWKEQPAVILLDKEKSEEDAQVTYCRMFPESTIDILQLCNDISERPMFKETSTHCLPYKSNKECNPIFLFPGLNTLKLQVLVRNMIYPTFVAKYPLCIKSVNELASELAKFLIDGFDLQMFTLIAEGWSGPLVFSVAKILEENGRKAGVILLDADPLTIKKWGRIINKSKSAISIFLPSLKENEEIRLTDLKSWLHHLSTSIVKIENGAYSVDEIRHGLETMINRLELVSSFPEKHFTIKAPVHLFTPENEPIDIDGLNQMCELPITSHTISDVSADNFLSSSSLLIDIINLVILEYKNAATPQIIEEIFKIDFIKDSRYNSAGISRE